MRPDTQALPGSDEKPDRCLCQRLRDQNLLRLLNTSATIEAVLAGEKLPDGDGSGQANWQPGWTLGGAETTLCDNSLLALRLLNVLKQALAMHYADVDADRGAPVFHLVRGLAGQKEDGA